MITQKSVIEEPQNLPSDWRRKGPLASGMGKQWIVYAYLRLIQYNQLLSWQAAQDASLATWQHLASSSTSVNVLGSREAWEVAYRGSLFVLGEAAG